MTEVKFRGRIHGDEDEHDLYTQHLETFRQLLAAEPEVAIEAYGFAFYFSLPDIDRLRIRKKIESPKTAADFYNYAAVAIQDGQWNEAIQLLNDALKLDANFADAVYNLALCYEKIGDKPSACKAWEKFLSITNDSTLKEQVTAHVAEMTSV